MSAQSETTASALGRLHADAEDVAKLLAVGRDSVPQLAMGSDAEALVHVGFDGRGEIVRLDLLPGWRESLTFEGLGPAVTEALAQASQVRLGDWAAGLLAAAPRTPGAPSMPDGGASDIATPASARVGPVWLDEDAAAVRVDPDWVRGVDDETLRTTLLATLSVPAPAREPDPLRLTDVRALQRGAYGALMRGAGTLPTFMRAPVQTSLDRVGAGMNEALGLQVAGEGVASDALRVLAADLDGCRRLASRPAGLPEASERWASAAIRLTSGLAAARQPKRRPVLGMFRRGSRAAG